MRREHVKYALLEITFWASFGAFTAFAIPYLLHEGLSAGAVGAATAVNTVCSLCGSFVWNPMCDRTGSNKRVFLLLNALLMGLYAALYAVPKAALPVICLYGLLGFVQGPMVSVLDSWILREMRAAAHRFGPIRASASLVYSLFVLGYSRVIQAAGYWVMLPVCAAFIACTVAVGLLTRETRQPPRDPSRAAASSYGPVLANRRLLLIAGALLFMGMATAPNMLALSVLSGGVAVQGMGMFVGNLCSVPVMMFSPRLHRVPVLLKIAGASTIYIAGHLSMSLVPAPAGVMLASACNGMAYGTLLPAMRQAVAEAADDDCITRAQGLAEAAFSAAGPTLSNAASGLVVEHFGARALMLVCAAIQLVPLTGFLRMGARAKRA